MSTEPAVNDYAAFLASKRRPAPSSGIPCTPGDVHPGLFEFQRHIVAWAVRRGRAAIWADAGLGKSRQQIEWARQIGEPTLILAPLAVTHQTITEAAAIGVEVRYVRDAAEASAARADGFTVVISNYERMHLFDAARFGAVVLDESSVLAPYSGTVKRALVKAFAATPYRLCCSATPAPNDIEELCNHADFLGVMSPAEMRSTFFIADSRGEFMRYRLKGHAKRAFYDWLATWAIACRTPADLGCNDAGYELPELSIVDHFIETDWAADGELFTPRLEGVTQRAQVRRDTVAARDGAEVAGFWCDNERCGAEWERDRTVRRAGAGSSVVQVGDTSLWMGCVARVRQVADDGSWADLLVTQQDTRAMWTKRQPLPLPDDAVRYEGHPFPPVTFTELP